MESLLPFLKGLFVGRKKKKANGDKLRELSDVALTEYDQFDDYLEMVIQFGVCTYIAIVLSPCRMLPFIFFHVSQGKQVGNGRFTLSMA